MALTNRTIHLLRKTRFSFSSSPFLDLKSFSNTSPIYRTMTTVTTSLEEALRNALEPMHLEIRNESYKHKGPKDAESHFQVIIVSNKFDNLPMIKRHRLVNQACQTLLDGPIHALSIVAKTPEQWKSMANDAIPGTPNCRGGDKR